MARPKNISNSTCYMWFFHAFSEFIKRVETRLHRRRLICWSLHVRNLSGLFTVNNFWKYTRGLVLLVDAKNRDLWESLTPEVRDSKTFRHSAHAQSKVWQIWLAEITKRLLWACSETRIFPEIANLGADQEEHGFWGRECLDRMKFRQSLFARLVHDSTLGNSEECEVSLEKKIQWNPALRTPA